MTQSYKSKGKAGTLTAALFTIVLFAATSLSAAEPKVSDQKFIQMQTSLNAMMVSVVDWAAHEIWEAGEAETLTGRNWLTVRQYAIELLTSGTLVSLGGTGPADQGWVRKPAWQEWTNKMIEETKTTLAAIEAKDQKALAASGGRLVDICEGCHDAFKPDLPTEGILHVPHHEYGDSFMSR